MLRIIMGRAGTGKTTLLLERMKAVVQQGEQAVLIVPEQYSFEGELNVQRALGPKFALGVQVLSFTRLCNSVFRLHGGLAGIPVSKTGRYLLMSLAVAELQDKLVLYKKSAANPSFLDTLVHTCAEMKTAGVTPVGLEAVAAACEKGTLRDKLADISALYAAYQALLERGYTDPDDDLIKAAAVLREDSCYGDTHIFVDGFATFMAGEFILLEQLIAQAKEFTIALSAPGLHDTEQGAGVFSTTIATARRLQRAAKMSGSAVASPVLLEEPKRYRNDALAHLSMQYLQPDADAYPGTPRHIYLHDAADPYRETEYVAASLSRLVRDKGYSYSDIAVVVRDTGSYLRALESIFPRWNIPYSVDDKQDAENTVLMGGLMAAVEAVRSNFDGDAVLAWAKAPLAAHNPDDVSALENYCYCWGVRGALWMSEWKNNPRGLAGTILEEDITELKAINSTREAVIRPLINLRDRLRGTPPASCNGRQFAEALFSFLEEIDAPQRLTDFAEALPQGGREAFLDESAQLWDMLVEILDVFGSVLATSTFPLARLYELFRLALSTVELGQIPQTLDQVLVGSADRIRPGEVKAVFLVGAVDGEFPANFAGGGVFTDEERGKIITLGAEIGAPAYQKAVLEQYFCYFAATLPSERLYVSYHRSKMSGAECFPSQIVTALLNIFPTLRLHRPNAFEQVGGDPSAFDLLAGCYRQDTPETAALLSYFASERAEALSRMERAAIKQAHEVSDPALARELFGTRMVLSPSRVERYHNCAFAYFARDGLRLQRRRKVEFSPLESGSVIHHVLQVMVQRHGSALFDMETRPMKAEIKAIIDGYLAERVEEMEALPERFAHLFERLGSMLVRLLRHLGEELRQSAYEPAFFEMPIGRDGVKPLDLRTADGVTVQVEGIVDRVDIMERGDKRYIRVVDYKSGRKEFRLDDVLCGLNLQMLLYLFTIAENGRGKLADAIPAGVLYLPATGEYVNVERAASEREVDDTRKKQWKMSGILLDDEESLRGMERDLAGVFIPVKQNKKGEIDTRSALAGKAELGRISRKIKDTIKEMAQRLTLGQVPAMPVSSGGRSPCEYCDYAALCGFEAGDPVKNVARMSTAAVLKLLEEEEEAVEKLD